MGQAELAQDLRYLGDVAEHVGQVPDGHRPSVRLGTRHPGLQIAHERLGRHEEFVGQRVPRAHREAAGPGQVRHALGGLGTHGKVVVEHGHLTVEQEVGVGRVGLEALEQFIEQLDETGPGPAGTGGTPHGPSTMFTRRGLMGRAYARRRHPRPAATRLCVTSSSLGRP